MVEPKANTTFSGARFDHLREMAKEIHVPLYKRFTEAQACDMVGVSIQTLRRLRKTGRIAYVQVSERHIQYFGWQVLDYLWSQVRDRQCRDTPDENSKLETTGFQGKPEAPHGAELGTTPRPTRRDEYRSAQRILGKPKND